MKKQTKPADPRLAATKEIVIQTLRGSHGPMIRYSDDFFCINIESIADGYFVDDHVKLSDGIERGEKSARDVADLLYRFLMAKAGERMALRFADGR